MNACKCVFFVRKYSPVIYNFHMNIYEQLKTIKLSGSEKSLRDRILADPLAFSQMRTDEIIKTCHTSRATIYRLCEKLDVDGITGLKLRIGTDYKAWKEIDQAFDYDYPVKEGMSVQGIAASLETDYSQTVLSTKNLLDTVSLRRAALGMEKADAIDIYTSAGNIFFAQNFAFQMKEIGVDVNVPQELYLQTLYAASSGPHRFAVVISFGGRNWQIGKVCRTLKENGTPILLICSPQASGLFEYSDMRLYFSSHEDHYKKISSFSTRLSLLYILDVLYTCFFDLHYEGNVRKKDGFYQKLSDKW